MVIFTNKIFRYLADMINPPTAYQIPQNVLVISAINRQRDRLGAARFTYPVVGKASGRIAYDLGDGNVLKLAWNKKGIAQNRAESKPCLTPYYDLLLVPVLASDHAGKWVIQPQTTPLSVSGFFDFARSAEGRAFCQKAHRFAQLHGLNYYDLTKPASIGFTDDKHLIFDYGLTQAISEQYYSNQ